MEASEGSYDAHTNSFRMLEGETLAGILADYEACAKRTDDLVRDAARPRRCRTRCRRRRGSSPAPAGRPAGCSCTSSPRPPSTPATPTSSARRSTARSRWAEASARRCGPMTARVAPHGAGDRFDRDRLVARPSPPPGSTTSASRPGRRASTGCSTASPREARLNELGVTIVETEVGAYLRNRLGIVAHRAAHPELGDRCRSPDRS